MSCVPRDYDKKTKLDAGAETVPLLAIAGVRWICVQGSNLFQLGCVNVGEFERVLLLCFKIN